jgi:hypothetical protein
MGRWEEVKTPFSTPYGGEKRKVKEEFPLLLLLSRKNTPLPPPKKVEFQVLQKSTYLT